MGFRKFVQAGRVAYVTFGPHHDKLCVIVDIIDGTSVIIDCQPEQIPRMPIPTKRLYLTDYLLDIERGANTEEVAENFKRENIREKWEETPWGKNAIKRQKRSTMNDFDRFRVMCALRTKNFHLRQIISKS